MMAIDSGITDVHRIPPTRPLKPVNPDTPRRERKPEESEQEEQDESLDKDGDSIIDEYA